ncbi:hypothetical protein CCYS_05965 [Corynebacterium cystitidis DSM 20524]|uniref:Transposase n=1 Tax=Corynebacterium cystitidis DSM 20524 TaxID=1121357 RepID=A0A1H9RXK1_9CORY|nr:hypothetical protein CCYS_05965 [Corynebacterium cystitidis DSM 20524]SER77540.1 hypothetical protein SAMN05661109_00968 [Corynebacterium cystitidis DSM 20524]SNV78901.1 transposase [Corynebacterium cystitidis]
MQRTPYAGLCHVESAVYIVERSIMEYLDDREFFSFDELNDAIATRVEWINDRNEFRKSTTSRRELFAEYERGTLMDLPKYPWSWPYDCPSRHRFL